MDECDSCFRDLEFEYREGSRRDIVVSLDIFKTWFNDMSIKQELAAINSKSFFAILLEEASNVSHDGDDETETAVEENDLEEGEEDNAGVIIDKAHIDTRRSVLQRMSFAWNKMGEKKNIFEVEGDFVDRSEKDELTKSEKEKKRTIRGNLSEAAGKEVLSY